MCPTPGKLLLEGPDQRLSWDTGYLREARAIADNYRRVADEQEAMAATGADIAMLAAAIAHLSNVRDVEVAGRRRILSEDDDRVATKIRHWGLTEFESMGLNMSEIFLQTCYAGILNTSTTDIASIVLSAVGEATNQGWKGQLESLRLDGPNGDDSLEWDPQALQLQNMSIKRHLLDTAKSCIRHLVLNVHPYTCDSFPNWRGEIARAKTNLCCLISPTLEDLTLDFLDATNIHRTPPTISESCFAAIVDKSHKSKIRRLRLIGDACVRVADVTRFISANCHTLEDVEIRLSDTTLAQGTERQSAFLRAARKCDRLERFHFSTESTCGVLFCNWHDKGTIEEGFKALVETESLQPEEDGVEIPDDYDEVEHFETMVLDAESDSDEESDEPEEFMDERFWADLDEEDYENPELYWGI